MQDDKELYTILSKFKNSQHSSLVVLAVLVGIGAGYAAVGFRLLIQFFQKVFFGYGHQVLFFMGDYWVVIIPALGAVIFGPLVIFLAREAKGHGVPEVMAAVAFKGGRIRPRVTIVKAFASALNIGSGGSVGREGPIVQIGSAWGSTVGQALKLSDEKIRTLVACGAAGGIAATFNAPIAGVFFALEVIAGQFATGTFTLTVLASVAASVIGRYYMGSAPAFSVPPYSLNHPAELFLYLGLGVLAGIFSIIYIKVLYGFEDAFDNFKIIPEFLRPILGGLIVGSIGFFRPEIFGVGYETIEKALAGQLLLTGLVGLLFLKLLATSVTIGSGGSGGVFAPGLFMGAMLGGAFGMLVNNLFPGITAASGAYALVGMGAVFAGSARAPITAIIILFELTNDYRIILPLMIACVISTLISGGLHEESIYTVKLSRRGLKLLRGQSDLMASILVEQVMSKDVDTVSQAMPVGEVAEKMRTSLHHGFPVVDSNQLLVGMITYQDVRKAVVEGKEKIKVGSIASRNVVVAYPQETLRSALEKMARKDIGRLPVVEREHPNKIVGLITRSDIISVYNQAAGTSA